MNNQQTPPTADQRHHNALMSIEECEQYISKDFEEMHSLIADLNASTSDKHPITVVADLLQYWLEKANPDLTADTYRYRMVGALELINVFRQLGALSEGIYYGRDELAQLRKEVAGE